MMGLFTKHYYHKSTRAYGAVLTSIFSELQVRTEGKLVEIPLTPLGGARGKPQGQSPTNGVYPRGTIAFKGYVPADERQLNNSQHRLQTADHTGIQLMRMPVGYQFVVSYRFKQADQAYQAIEQVVPAFTPSLDFKWADNTDLANIQNIKAKLDSYGVDDNWEGAGDEPDYHDVTFTLTVNGHFYRRTSDAGIIETVVIDLALFPEELGDIPVDINDKSHNWIVTPEPETP